MAASNPTGKAILQASLRLFRQDRQMIWLPVMATITAVIAFAIIAGPVARRSDTTGSLWWWLWPAAQSWPPPPL